MIEFFKKLFRGSPSAEQPEDLYETQITEKTITVTHPKRGQEYIDWENIEKISLLNTDQGPWLPDVWLTLEGKSQRCTIPQGSTGYDLVYDIVSKYNDFNFENVTKSMTCTDNAEFLLWKK